MINLKKVERSLIGSFDDDRYAFLEVSFADDVDHGAAFAAYRDQCCSIWKTVVKFTAEMWDEGQNNLDSEISCPSAEMAAAFDDKTSPLLNCAFEDFRQVVIDHIDGSAGAERDFFLYMLGVMTTATNMSWFYKSRSRLDAAE